MLEEPTVAKNIYGIEKENTAYCDYISLFNHERRLISVNEWKNGEGWTVDLNGKAIFQLTREDFDILKKCIKKLYKRSDNELLNRQKEREKKASVGEIK